MMNYGLNPSMLHATLSQQARGYGGMPAWMPQMQSMTQIPQYLAGAQSPTSFPSNVERRVIRATFALYKHHHKNQEPFDAARHAWFENRFNVLWSLLRGHLNSEDTDAITSWMKLNRMHPMQLPVSTAVIAPMLKKVPMLSALPGFEPTAMNSGFSLGSIVVSPEDLRINCDDGIFHSLGYLSEDFKPRIGWPSGMLSFGADVIARIAVKDDDVFSYIRKMAANIKAMSQGGVPAASVVQVGCEMNLAVMHKSGVQVACRLLATALGSFGPDGFYVQVVAFSVLMPLPGQAAGAKGYDFDLGPWTAPSSPQDSRVAPWLKDILAWA